MHVGLSAAGVACTRWLVTCSKRQSDRGAGSVADVVHDHPQARRENEKLALAHLDVLVADDCELDVAEDREDAHVEHVNHASNDVAAVLVVCLDEQRLGEDPLEVWFKIR